MGGLWGIDAADGAHLWSERYDREMSDIFTLLAVR
jgi:TolB-like protein